jgi:hypothetical protein
MLDFGIDKSKLKYTGHDLQRSECILAEPDGTLWSADARGGVMRIVTQRRSEHFEGAASEASRFLEGTLPNGLAFAGNGDILISSSGTDCLEIMTRPRPSDSIDGEPIGKVNFVHRDSKDRIWITVSTRIRNWITRSAPISPMGQKQSRHQRRPCDAIGPTPRVDFDYRLDAASRLCREPRRAG